MCLGTSCRRSFCTVASAAAGPTDSVQYVLYRAELFGRGGEIVREAVGDHLIQRQSDMARIAADRQGSGRRLGALGVATGDDHIGAAFCQRSRERLAQVTGGSGHQGCLSGKVQKLLDGRFVLHSAEGGVSQSALARQGPVVGGNRGLAPSG